MRLDVALDELLPRPVDIVWSALTDAAAISDWLMATTDFQPRVGARFRLKRQTDGAGWVDAEVLELDPPRRMVWAWSMDEAAPPTTVTFELSPEAGGTRLRLTHVGEIDDTNGNLFQSGWPGRLDELARVAQRRSEHD